jgi:hypothetical protein
MRAPRAAALTVASATTAASSGLIINATFDGSITSNPNAAAIEAAINRAIAIFESLFSDRLTIPILFRYSTKGADGSPVVGVSQSEFAVYPNHLERIYQCLGSRLQEQ